VNLGSNEPKQFQREKNPYFGYELTSTVFQKKIYCLRYVICFYRMLKKSKKKKAASTSMKVDFHPLKSERPIGNYPMNF